MTIKLQAGDYVLTEGLADDQIEDVVQAFIKAGAAKNCYENSYPDIYDNVLGWDARDSEVYTWKHIEGPVFGEAFTGRRLTYEEVMQAGNDAVNSSEDFRVGDVVEAYDGNRWAKAELLKEHGGKWAVFFVGATSIAWAEDVRSIPSKREQWIEQSHKVSGVHESNLVWRGALGEIYDAIAQGELPIPEDI